MARTRVKICGVTRAQDALVAAEAGADAIGMVFHRPVKRNISIETAREIVSALPPFVTPVGVFVDAPAEEIRSVCTTLQIRHVQLNGNESAEFVSQLGEFTITKALKVETGKFPAALSAWKEKIASLRLTNLQGFVLESAGAAPGGSGKQNDWAEAERALSDGAFRGLPRVIAAGGLTPQTVGDVVRRLRPYAVDVSSGVEDEVGKKSPEKIRAFIAAVREADGDR